MNRSMSRSRRRTIAIRVVIVVLLVILAPMLGACDRDGTGSGTPSTQLNAQTPDYPPITPTAAPDSYAPVVQRVAPAVVTIRSEMIVRAPQQQPFMNDPFFRHFFGLPDQGTSQEPQQYRESGLGSGVIVSPDGYILTNHHVIDGAEDIEVNLTDGRSFKADVVGSDPPSDLAVLKIKGTDLPTLPFGNSDSVRVGDVVLAVGNPLGIGQTVTSGIISAKGRTTGLSNGSFEDFLQTDAPINRGNSGGPLVDTHGRMIGINSQILSPTGASIGIGFAIPSTMAKDVMQQLISTGHVRRGQLGVIVQPVTSDIAESLGMKKTRGVIVSQVQSGSAAEDMGVKRGDVIVAFNGEPVDDPNVLRNHVASTTPKSSVTLTVVRNGDEKKLTGTLGELTSEGAKPTEQTSSTGESTTGKLGISVRQLTPDIAQQLGLDPDTQGLVIGQVNQTGPAADAGLRNGDVILEVNRQKVASVGDLRDAVDAAGDHPLLLLIARNGQDLFVTVRPNA